MRRQFAFLLGLLLLHGCAAQPERAKALSTETTSVLEVADLVQQGWRYYPVKGHTTYRIVAMDGQLAIQATGAGGAGGMIRRVQGHRTGCSHLDWVWRLERLQPSADLSRKDRDDVAASVFVLFGDPGFLSSPTAVPTIRYVWTTRTHAPDTVIANPYMPGLVKNIVLRVGDGEAGRWLTERRDLVADFRRAFGRAPEDAVGAVAIFTDNDQTGEPVMAYYGRIDCR